MEISSIWRLVVYGDVNPGAIKPIVVYGCE